MGAPSYTTGSGDVATVNQPGAETKCIAISQMHGLAGHGVINL